MSARHERQWWSLSSKNSSSVGPVKHDVDLTRSFNQPDKPRKHSVGMKFSSITSAMGFKSKKHPTLAIQEPPPEIRPKAARVDTQTVRYPNRPPAKSVSTVQSWDDPNEPQTPLDVVKEGMPRVLTTSDPDLYSSRGIRCSPTLQDPNRLSAYSSSSISDTLSRKDDSAIAFKRLSDASSSLSQYLAVDYSPTSSSASLHSSVNGRQPSSSSKRSITQRRKPSLLVPVDPTSSWNGAENLFPDEHPYPSLSKSISSSTLKEKTRLGEAASDVAPHKITRRRRGMTLTDGSSISSTQSRSQFLCNASSPPKSSLPPPPNDQLASPNSPISPISPISPRMLVRQSSASRIGPPSAPPSGSLPAPPMGDSLIVDDETALRTVSRGSSSSSLSFALTAPPGRIPLNGIGSRKKESPSGVHTVKKSISHQNFTKRHPYNLTTGSGSSTPVEQLEDKSPHRQRSFRNSSRILSPSSPSSPSRQPPPPVPPPPKSPLSPSSPESSMFVEQCRGTSVRKRLFSGGSSGRPPISQTFSAGDVNQSISTAEYEQTQGVSTAGSTKSSVSSTWDDRPSDPCSSSPGPSTSEYTPQMIVSPAEMLRMEASFNEGSDEYDYVYPTRQRVHSLMSPSTSGHGSEGLSSPGSPTHYIIDRGSGTSSGAKRSPSVTRSGLPSPLRHSLRPSTSQNSMASNSPLFPSSKPSSPPIGLPPPPRPRRQIAIINDDTTVSPSTPTPSIRRVNTTTGARTSLVRSIMRKPSFLDIEDETHKRPLSVASAFVGSFLELERGKDSFDTIRSEDE